MRRSNGLFAFISALLYWSSRPLVIQTIEFESCWPLYMNSQSSLARNKFNHIFSGQLSYPCQIVMTNKYQHQLRVKSFSAFIVAKLSLMPKRAPWLKVVNVLECIHYERSALLLTFSGFDFYCHIDAILNMAIMYCHTDGTSSTDHDRWVSLV